MLVCFGLSSNLMTPSHPLPADAMANNLNMKRYHFIHQSCRSEEKVRLQPHCQPLPLPFKEPLRFRFHLCSRTAQPFFLCRSIETRPGAPCCGNPSSGAGRRLVPRPDSNGTVEDAGGGRWLYSACGWVGRGGGGGGSSPYLPIDATAPSLPINETKSDDIIVQTPQFSLEQLHLERQHPHHFPAARPLAKWAWHLQLVLQPSCPKP